MNTVLFLVFFCFSLMCFCLCFSLAVNILVSCECPCFSLDVLLATPNYFRFLSQNFQLVVGYRYSLKTISVDVHVAQQSGSATSRELYIIHFSRKYAVWTRKAREFLLLIYFRRRNSFGEKFSAAYNRNNDFIGIKTYMYMIMQRHIFFCPGGLLLIKSDIEVTFKNPNYQVIITLFLVHYLFTCLNLWQPV